ncbi:MAG: 30S ribosomal protein S4 [Candidatus Pacebacteria bacterium]|nr:30S ribosomal protein S4 [Candidatus Paceibacterota bacterium]
MKIGPKYKIARRLGVPVFEKTQTQKYAMRAARKDKTSPIMRSKSEYGQGLLEKQKARMSYGVTSSQFTNYVKAAIAKKGDSAGHLVTSLESRLDNAVLRGGLAPTRRAARQMVSHGHINVNGGRVNIPSYSVSIGDKISVRARSAGKALFAKLDESWKTVKLPAWLKLDIEKKELAIDGLPTADKTELLFDVGTVLEFFSR